MLAFLAGELAPADARDWELLARALPPEARVLAPPAIARELPNGLALELPPGACFELGALRAAAAQLGAHPAAAVAVVPARDLGALRALPHMTRALAEHELVLGSRCFPGGSSREPRARRAARQLGGLALRALLRIDALDPLTPLYLWRRAALERVIAELEAHSALELRLAALCACAGAQLHVGEWPLELEPAPGERAPWAAALRLSARRWRPRAR